MIVIMIMWIPTIQSKDPADLILAIQSVHRPNNPCHWQRFQSVNTHTDILTYVTNIQNLKNGSVWSPLAKTYVQNSSSGSWEYTSS